MPISFSFRSRSATPVSKPEVNSTAQEESKQQQVDETSEKQSRSPAHLKTNGIEYLFGTYVELSSAGAARVYKAVYRGRPIVVKAFKTPRDAKPDAAKKINERLDMEARTWTALCHKNIMPFYGWIDGEYYGTSYSALVTPYVEGDTILKYLMRKPDADRIGLIAGIADGLAHLHAQKFNHGDIKANNVMVVTTYIASRFIPRPLLCDIGLSRAFGNAEPIIAASRAEGNLPWLAPERMHAAALDKDAEQHAHIRADVWSWANTTIEVITGKRPYHDIQDRAMLQKTVAEGRRPAYSRSRAAEKGLTPELDQLLKRCWSRDPAKRPVMEEVAKAVWEAIEESKQIDRHEWTSPESPRPPTGKQTSRGRDVFAYQRILRDYNPLVDCTPSLDEIIDLAAGDVIQVTSEVGEWKRGSMLRCEAHVYEVPVELATQMTNHRNYFNIMPFVFTADATTQACIGIPSGSQVLIDNGLRSGLRGRVLGTVRGVPSTIALPDVPVRTIRDNAGKPTQLIQLDRAWNKKAHVASVHEYLHVMRGDIVALTAIRDAHTCDGEIIKGVAARRATKGMRIQMDNLEPL